MKLRRDAVAIAMAGLFSASSFAWGPDGHHVVGAIASKLISGTRAAAEVKALLGDLTLENATVWADCAKGIDPGKNYEYQHPGKYPECKIFETPELEAEMSDFVRRNDQSCHPEAGEESCHRQYHYTDVAIQRDRYVLGSVGARDDDIVGAVAAATQVLKGNPSPPPFNIKSKREALLILAHYIGDLHQPLHVGAIYLNAKGTKVDPNQGSFDPITATRGGNNIVIQGKNMHAMWDAIPASMMVNKVNAAWLGQAKKVAATPTPESEWPATWATGTLGGAKLAFKGVKFAPTTPGHWTATLPKNYATSMNAVKRQQLTAAGAHFAELLKAVWN